MNARRADPPRRSLRRRLLGLVSIAAVAILALATQMTYRQAHKDIQELMDGQLSRTGHLMLAQAQQGAEHLAQLPAAMENLRNGYAHRGAHATEIPLEYQIGLSDGRVLVRSTSAPDTRLTGHPGFSTIRHDGAPWRSLLLESDDGRYRIQVTESIPARDKEAFEIATKTVLPLLVVFPLLLLAIYVSIRRGLKPLDDLANEVLHRTPENLVPLEDRATPREALPLVAAINRLLYRLSGSLDHERRFTADAAHELRTPLAAIRVQTQVAAMTQDETQRQHALTQAQAGLDRAARLLEEMLRLARLDPMAQLPSPSQLKLTELVQQVVTEFRDHLPTAVIQTRLAEHLPPIEGDADLLRIALRNLIDNALRYAPQGSPIEIDLHSDASAVTLSVRDHGPGVDEAELPRLVERFYRGNAVNAEGSGLGLTLVDRIAELHGARLALANREGGGFEGSICWNTA